MALPPKAQEIVDRLKQNPAAREIALRKVTDQLWRRGDLRYKLHATQRLIYAALEASAEQQFYLLCSRRLGKTYMLLARSFETCLRKPGARVLFLAPEKQMARDIVNDVSVHLLHDCPEDIKPEFKGQYTEWHFKNGSILRLKGVNQEQADSLRGGAVDLVVVDEAAQMDNLLYIVESVLGPMTLTTNGRIILATTPPVTPDHESKILYDRAFGRGASVKFTLLDAPHISHEGKVRELRTKGEAEDDIPDILAGAKRAKTTAALREYFCEFVTDASMKVIKEWDERAKAECVKVVEEPPFFDAYVGMDPGFQDRTGLIFAHYNWSKGAIVIQDEALLHQASTSRIAETLLEREYALWGDKKPLLRVSDVDPRLIQDLREQHGIDFMAADKQRSLEALQLVRTMIINREILIDPRCVQLIHQLDTTIWNKKATDFERTTEGHGDLLAALKYLCRHINRHKNPYPAGYYIRSGGTNEHRSPRRRFWPGRSETGAMLGKTPFAKRIRKKRGEAFE